MGQDIPPAPPEAEVIRLARKATGMTAEDAAAASKAHDPAGKGVSATYWRDVERGHGGRRGKQVTTRASDRILAAMARVVEVTPGQLTGAGREDAARVLAEILRRERPVAAVPDPIPRPADGDTLDGFPFKVTPAMRARIPRVLEAVKADVATAVEKYPGQVLSGAMVFPNAPVPAGYWDDLAALGWMPDRIVAGVTVWMARRAEKAEQERRDGSATGLIRRYLARQPVRSHSP